MILCRRQSQESTTFHMNTNRMAFSLAWLLLASALDAKTGAPVPTFGVHGVVDLRLDDDQEMDLESADIGLHATPIVAKNTIIIGAAHLVSFTPKSKKNVKGYVRAFDVKTGKRL